MRTETKQDILSADELGTRYDQAAKQIWRNREILAPLLKYVIKELNDETVESIMALIDADTIRDDMPVSDLAPTVIDRGTEQNSTTEMPITYDLRFILKNPKLSVGKMLVMIHVDLEFQNKYRPVLKDGRSYSLITRGIYYAAREISSQLGRITEHTNYADLEKVVSIWIVNDDIPCDIRNTATRYYFTKDDFIGETDEPKEEYDLMEVVIVRRGEDDGITEPIFDYLKSVFDADLERIDKYTPASTNPEIVKEVSSMPGMSKVIYQNGVNDGVAQGMEQGVISLVIDGDISVDRAAEKLNKTPDEIQRILNSILASKEDSQ